MMICPECFSNCCLSASSLTDHVSWYNCNKCFLKYIKCNFCKFSLSAQKSQAHKRVVHHSLQCNSRIDDSDSFKSNVGSNYDGEKYSFSPQKKMKKELNMGILNIMMMKMTLKHASMMKVSKAVIQALTMTSTPLMERTHQMCCRGI